MKSNFSRIVLTGLVLGLSFSNEVSANQVVMVENICEVIPGGANTVRVAYLGADLLNLTFQSLSGGQSYVFASAGLVSGRKLSLPAGTYKLTYQNPNFPAVGTYPQNVVVKPFKVSGGSCVFISIFDRAERVKPLSQ